MSFWSKSSSKTEVRPFCDDSSDFLCCGCLRMGKNDEGQSSEKNNGNGVVIQVENLDQNAEHAVCDIRDSPFRILRVAESGNVKLFTKLVTADPSKLNVRDGRGRAPVHQASSRNHVAILQVIVDFGGDLDLLDFKSNAPIHLCIETESLDALDFIMSNGANPGLYNEKKQTPLIMACELNKPRPLKIMARYRSTLEPNMGDEHGRTPLHVAAINDHVDCMKILLYDIGACPRRKDKHGFFPIHEAAKHASSGSMDILLTWGENNGLPREEMISFFDSEGNVPLHSAVHGGDIKAVSLCLRSGAKISMQQHDLSTAVHLACAQGSIEIVKLMFTLQPEEKVTCLLSCDLQRYTPLHLAAMFDHHELVEYLVNEGASINVLDKDRRTPLHLSSARNGWRTMKTLIRLGGKVDLKDNESRNILHTIVYHGGDLDKILDEDTTKEFIPILEEKDKNGKTPLHYAAKLGHIKTAEKLLSLGANIITKTNEGENVFHIACRYGRLNIVQQILRMDGFNSVINEGNGAGQTPLHIASMEGHLRVVQALMKKGALLHRDHMGRTPLHLAAKNGYKDTMRLILNVHSHLLDQTDKDLNTALHLASMENHPEAIEFLLSMNCKLLYNINGFSAIDYALQNKLPAVAHVMVNHRSRGDETLAMTSGKHPSIMLGLIATMPQVVTAVLDRCIKHSDNKTDSEEFHIRYNFKWLSLAESMHEDYPKGLEKNEVKYGGGEMKHLPILNGMVNHGRVELLSHGLSQKYLGMKWKAYGKYIHFAHLILYTIYLTILTTFASSSYVKYRAAKYNDPLYTDGYETESPINDNISSIFSYPTIVTNYDDANGDGKIGTYVGALIILVVSIFNCFREAFNIFNQRFKYFLDSVNWIFWAMNISSILMVLPRLFPGLEFKMIANPCASMAAFLSWFYLLLFLQRFDAVGIYVVMFLEILHTLLRVLTIFSILIVAFGLAFYILLSNGNHISFQGIPNSLMRTFSMMLGDLDFLNTFINPKFCSSESYETIGPTNSNGQKPHNKEEIDAWSSISLLFRDVCQDDRRLPHPIPSFVLLLIFMVFMPILLMNLLIGLAVGDIESVRRNAQLKRLAMQVHLHTHLEKTLPTFLLKRVDKEEVIEYPNARKVRLGILDNVLKYFQPKTHFKESTRSKDEELSDEVMGEIQVNQQSLISLASHLENVESLLRLLCQKMQVSTDSDFIDEGTQMESSNPMAENVKSKFKRNVTVRKTSRRPLSTLRSDSFMSS